MDRSDLGDTEEHDIFSEAPQPESGNGPLLWLRTEPDAKPNSFKAMTLISGEKVMVAEFEVYDDGRLLGYKPNVTDAAADHDAVREWIAAQAEQLETLTAQRQP